MQMNAMPIDSMLGNEKKNINLMLFNEIGNFIEVYVIIRLLNSYSVLGPRSLVGLITSQAR